MSDVWYLAKDGKQFGPFTLAELQVRLRGFELGGLFVWRDGYDEWTAADQIADLKPRPPMPPPFTAKRESDAVKGPSGPEKQVPEKSVAWYGLKALDRLVGIAAFLIVIGLSKALGAVFWLPILLIMGTYAALKKMKVRAVVIPMCCQTISGATTGNDANLSAATPCVTR